VKGFKRGLISILLGFVACISISPVVAQMVQTNLAVVVRHAPNLNGNGRIEGSVQQLLGEDVTLNGGFAMTGDLLVPGTPTLRVNGHPTFAGTIAGNGSASPKGYGVTLNGNCSLCYLRTRTTPVSLPTVPMPLQPVGTRTVTLNVAARSIGDPATLRNLTLNGNAGQVAVPPGTYGAFTVNGDSGFTLGVAGALRPAIYNLQSLNLNGHGRLEIIGPVILRVANGFSANGILGAASRSSWLQLEIACGGITLNGGCTVYGNVTAPAGMVIVNGNSRLIGSAQCDRLIVNGDGIIRAGTTPNRAPVANAESFVAVEDTPLNITLTGSDAEGASLSFIVLSPPMHGILSPEPPGLQKQCQGGSTLNKFVYNPATNYNGSDSFTFKVNDGQTDSPMAAISITVTPANDPPVALAQSLSTSEDTPLNITLIGTDADNDLLTFKILTAPAKGELIGVAPHLTYTPWSNTNGSDIFTFRVSDGHLAATNVVYITIIPVNDPPIADPQAITTMKDSATNIVLSGSDVEGDALTFQIVTPPAHGVLQGAAPRLVYSPAAAYRGTDRFSFVANDGRTNSAPAAVSITVVAPPNTPPAVSIASPPPQSEFMLSQPIPVMVAASDSDGQVVSVKIFADEMLLAELTGPPFRFVWTNAALGQHILSATATDNSGSTAGSTNVTVSVLEPERGDFAVDAGPDQIIELSQLAFLVGVLEIQTGAGGSETNAAWIKASGPGNVRFSNSEGLLTTAQFSEPGTYMLRLRVACGGGMRTDTIVVTVLPVPPHRLTGARTTRGTDFWFAFLWQAPAGFENESYHSIVVAAESDTDVVVAHPVLFPEGCTEGWDQAEVERFHLKGGSTKTLSYMAPDSEQDGPLSDVIRSNAVHITASSPMTVYGMNREMYSADGLLALPTTLLGTNYVVLSYSNGGSEFAVVAAENETSVAITPNIATGERPDGVPFTIVLQQGEMYRLAKADGDFTGTSVASDKPVAVISGTASSRVPREFGYGDHLVEEMVPVNLWGRHFATMPLAPRKNGDTFRFVSAEDNTQVAVNGIIVANLNKGEFHERIIDGPAIILSTKPILTAQYANGTDFDQFGGGLGDPFMMQIPPVEQFGSDCLITTPVNIRNCLDAPAYTNYLNLVVFGDGVGTILLDGELVAASQFQPIHDSGYAGAQIPINGGEHQLSAPVPFNVCVYGWDWYESYGFMGGFYADSVEADTKLELTQPTSCAAVGNPKMVFARATNGRGSPLPDLQITFTTSGANSTTGLVRSSRLGDATFFYTGSNTGVDIITARVGDVAQSITNMWISTTNNTPPVVSTAGTQPLQFGLTAQLAGTVTDDGLPSVANLNTRWLVLDGPGPVQFDDATRPITRAKCSVPGKYIFQLTADDSQFSDSKQAMVMMDLLPAVQFPITEMPAVVEVGLSMALMANASDFDNVVDRVEFYANDTLIGATTNGDPWTAYSVNWIPSTNGLFHLRAVAVDGPGGSVSSDSVLMQVTFPPQIEAVLPDHDLALPYGASTTMFKARAWDSDGTVTNISVYFVSVYVGPVLICQVAGDQIDFTGPADVGGGFYDKYGTPHRVRFVATDNQGISAKIDTVNITFLPPTITADWASPVQDQIFRVGQTVNLVVEASVTPPALISYVTFYRWWEPPPWMWGATGYWNWVDQPATEEPYINHWIPTAPGDYQFKAIAAADTGTSEWVAIRTIHVLPAIGVSILSPADSAQLFTGRPCQISFALDDPTSAFDHAEFFANGASLGPTTNNSMSWMPSQTGNYTLTATVYDHQGQSYYPDTPVSVHVSAPPVPAISLEIIPAGKTNGLVGFPFLVAAEISMTNLMPVAKVEFFADGQSLGEITNAPFLFPYLSTNPGPHVLTARVTTDYGSTAESLPIAVECRLTLGVSWEGSHSGEWVPVGTNTTLGVRLDDPGSIYDHIEFLANGVALGSTIFCFLDWTPPAPGDYVMLARAHDRFGNTYDSEQITLHAAVLHKPEVRFASPPAMGRFSSGQPVSFFVQASDPDSVVTNLSLFRYSRPQVSIAGTALSYSWTNLPAGELQFTAVVTDDKGLTGEAKVRIVVDPPLSADLLPPRNLAAQVLGCNAIQISWDTNSGIATHLVVVERAEGTNDLWVIAGKVPLEKGVMENHFLHTAAVYRYRAYVRSAAGYRSVDSNVVVTRTRAYIPGFAVLDIAENMEDAGAFDVAAADVNVGPYFKSFHGLLDMPPGFGLRQPSGAFHTSKAAESRRSPRRCRADACPFRFTVREQLQNEQEAAAEPEYQIMLASFASQQDSDTRIVDLNGFSTLGISDLNSILLVGGLKNYVWRPGSKGEALTDTNFFPFRLTRSGWPVGTLWTEIPISPLTVVTQFHAGFWADGFMDLTPDVQALRFPMSDPPVSMPYYVYDVLTDMNSSGAAVGTASWVWVTSYDGQTSWITRGPVRRATLWPTNDQPPIDFGALQELNAVSESSFQAINDSGDIVGVSALYDPDIPNAQITHAVRSHISLAGTPDDKLTDLGTLGGFYSAAIAINNGGIAVGYSTVLPEDAIINTRAVCWLPTETHPRRLPGYDDTLLTYAHAINDENQIVGEAVDLEGVQRAVLWKPNSSATNGLGYDLVNLNDLVSRSDWNLTTARSINSGGLIVGSGLHLTEIVTEGGVPQSVMVPRAFLLMPNVSLAVDYNRDGRIELSGNDDMPGQLPYQFWVNDDSDGSKAAAALGIGDLPGARTGIFEFDNRDPDYADDKVNGAADLVDWFPVFLNISNLVAIFPPSQCEYRLVQSDGALNFLYSNLRPEEAGSYQTNALTSGFGADFNQPAATATGVQQVTSDGVALSAQFLDKIAREGRGVLLFEARQPTTQPLRLEVRNARRVVTSLELPLRISGAESMYGWANLRGVAGEAMERLSDLRPSNYPVFADEHQAFVFLHGYNVNERQSRAWAAEMFKRLWWSGSHRRFYAVSWHGEDTQVLDQTTINYHINVRHAFETAPVLASFLNITLSGQDVTIAAHSLGNMVVCSAIQDHDATPDRYYMLDAAVSMEAFDAGLTNQPFMTHPDWRGYPERLYASEWYRLFPDDDGRHALTWRGRFQDVPHLTELYNFYSSGEEALENRHDDSDPWITDIASFQLQWPTLKLPLNWLTGRYAWVLQETLKGRVTASDITALYSAAYDIGGWPLYISLHLADVREGNIMGSKYGGWGFNSFWDTAGSIVTINGGLTPTLFYVPGGHKLPQYATGIIDADLEAKPFFLPFLDARLTTSEGGPVASEMSDQLLAEAIPARTFAAGANRFDEKLFGKGRQFNMNEDFQKRGWPAERLQSAREQFRWKHSDLHDVACPYVGMVFEKFVELEGGR
jgi:hypothetical protein